MLKKKGIILIFGILLISLVSASSFGYDLSDMGKDVEVTTLTGNLTIFHKCKMLIFQHQQIIMF